MKKLFFLFLLAASALTTFAQRSATKRITTDTVQTVKLNGIFFKDRYQIRDDGTGNIPVRELVGDSATYSSSQVADYITASRKWAFIAYEASLKNKLDKTLNNIQRETLANIGYNIADSLKYSYGDAYMGDWTYRNGGNTDVTITRAANGNLRASGLPGVAANAFITVKVESNVHFQFRNYPTNGIHQTFVSQDGKTFRNMDANANVTFKKK